jgi:HTH-like domain
VPVVGMNRSTYRHQQTRHPSNRDVRRILLGDTIKELHVASRSAYGVRRMKAALFHERGLIVNRKLIRRIMAEHSLLGLPLSRKGRSRPACGPRCLEEPATAASSFTPPASHLAPRSIVGSAASPYVPQPQTPGEFL